MRCVCRVRVICEGKSKNRQTVWDTAERGIVACGEDDVPRLRAAPRGGEGSRNKVCNVVPYMFFSTASLVALLFVALPCLRVIMTAEMFTNLVRQFVQRYWYFRLS